MASSGSDIRAEIERIEEAIRSLRSGEMDPGQFRRVRVIQGIYPIRGGTDRYLLRVRVPLGRIGPGELRAVAAIADRFAGGRSVHLTTRQDLHIYGVPLPEIPGALSMLADAGMTSREACGDTVRNIVVCPYAGITRREPFDVSPHAESLGRHLLRNPLGQRLPRKFKVAFEGCSLGDHVGLLTNDIGARAVRSPEGHPGFRITLAGGLGAVPREGIELEPFTRCGDLPATVEAVLRLFDRAGDRTRRGRARLKFVAEGMGEQVFRTAVLAEREEVLRAASGSLPIRVEAVPGPVQGMDPPLSLSWPGAFPQRQDGLVALPARIPLGDLSPDQLRGIADLAESSGGTVRLTPDQRILFADVPEGRAGRVAAGLSALRGTPPSAISISRCAGTETCTVGTTRVRAMSALLEREVVSAGMATDESRSITVGISGCANGCGRHLLADVGLQGVSRNVAVDGGTTRSAPHYRLSLGGEPGSDGKVRFGTPVGRVPARQVPEAVSRILSVFRSKRMDGESLGETVSRLGISLFADPVADLLDPSPDALSEEDFFDLGPDGPVPFPPDRSGPKAP